MTISLPAIDFLYLHYYFCYYYYYFCYYYYYYNFYYYCYYCYYYYHCCYCYYYHYSCCFQDIYFHHHKNSYLYILISNAVITIIVFVECLYYYVLTKIGEKNNKTDFNLNIYLSCETCIS